MRCICTEGDAVTTITWSTRRSPCGFEQQRDVEHNGAVAMAPGPRNELALLPLDHRMQDAFQAGERIRLAQHRMTQRDTIDGAVAHRAWERCLDSPHGTTTARLHPMNSSVRVEHRNVGATEGCSSRGFPHAYAAGQAKDLHRDGRSAIMNWRSSSSTCGSIPNQARKPGTAWCSNMPMPSTVRSPRARAEDSNGVSNGT